MYKFENLGKSTRRGVKKCTKCGIYNGTKSIACKNKNCDMIFKDFSEKSTNKSIHDAVQLITGNFRKLFSVKASGKDQGNLAVGLNNTDYRDFVQLPFFDSDPSTEMALCFVENCSRLFQNSEFHTINAENSSSCFHIKSSKNSRVTATPLQLKHHAVLKMKIPRKIIEELWTLMNNNTNGVPLVQRVSKNFFVVKCKVSPKHPLGYLHIVFHTRKFNKNERASYFCGCAENVFQQAKCAHYYLCLCAFLSDSKLVQEFGGILNNFELAEMSESLTRIDAHKVPETLKRKQKISRKRKEKKTCYSNIQKATSTFRKIWPKINPIQIKILGTNDVDNPQWFFENWLSFVVESMNKLMVFENVGNLNTLTFTIPQDFYKALRSKIPFPQANQTDDNLEYEIINIMNIDNVKQIFNNSRIKLRISKRFILTSNSNYEEINENDESTSNLMPHFIYFLNVGQLTVDDSDDTNKFFIIEWALKSKKTCTGELKFQYTYGRKCL